MKSVLYSFVAITLSLAASLTAHAQVQRYDREKVKAQLEALKTIPPTSVTLTGSFSDPQKRKFVQFYLDKVNPKLEEQSALYMRDYSSMLMLDTGTYVTGDKEKDAAAMQALIAEQEECNRIGAQWSVDKEWTATIAEFAKLAEGLTGELPDFARRMHKNRQLSMFPESAQPLLEEVANLSVAYQVALKEVPAAQKTRDYLTRSMEIRRRFKAGEVSFEATVKSINELVMNGGFNHVGYEAVQKTGENLNRSAVIRTQLAKIKGFNTWAEYQLEASGQGYEVDYRSPTKQREFLTKLLRGVAPLYKKYVTRRMKEMNLEHFASSLRQEYMGLFFPPSLSQLQLHFPASQITNMWEQVMLESGFSPDVLKQIIVDDQYREGKNATMAYMAPVLAPYTENAVIDTDTLDFIHEPKGSPAYKPGFIYIMQNYSGGPGDLDTNYHEGGHALEALLKHKTIGTDEGYGYVEVPSMSMEHIGRDPQVLWHKMNTVDGKRPSMQEIETLVSNHHKAEIANIVHMVTSALYDLNIWDYDYTKEGAKTYMEQVEILTTGIAEQADLPPFLDTPIPRFYHHVSTTHYTSGNVRNIGYTYAEIASRMMARYMLNELEKLSGRRTFHAQPQLAKLFTERFFEQGWKKPFPANIEAITGEKFDPEVLVKEMAEHLGVECERTLTVEKHPTK